MARGARLAAAGVLSQSTLHAGYRASSDSILGCSSPKPGGSPSETAPRPPRAACRRGRATRPTWSRPGGGEALPRYVTDSVGVRAKRCLRPPRCCAGSLAGPPHLRAPTQHPAHAGPGRAGRESVFSGAHKAPAEGHREQGGRRGRRERSPGAGCFWCACFLNVRAGFRELHKHALQERFARRRRPAAAGSFTRPERAPAHLPRGSRRPSRPTPRPAACEAHPPAPRAARAHPRLPRARGRALRADAPHPHRGPRGETRGPAAGAGGRRRPGGAARRRRPWRGHPRGNTGCGGKVTYPLHGFQDQSQLVAGHRPNARRAARPEPAP